MDFISVDNNPVDFKDYYYVNAGDCKINTSIHKPMQCYEVDTSYYENDFVLVKKEDIITRLNQNNIHEKCIGIVDHTHDHGYVVHGRYRDSNKRELEAIKCSKIKVIEFVYVTDFLEKEILFEEIDGIRILISKYNLLPKFYNPYTKIELDYIMLHFVVFKSQFNIIMNNITDEQYNYIIDSSIENEILAEWLILNVKNKLNSESIDKMIQNNPNLIQYIGTKSEDAIKRAILHNKKFWCHIPNGSKKEIYEYAVEQHPELIKNLRRNVSTEFLKKALNDKKYTSHIKKETLDALRKMYL